MHACVRACVSTYVARSLAQIRARSTDMNIIPEVIVPHEVTLSVRHDGDGRFVKLVGTIGIFVILFEQKQRSV